MVLPPRNRPPRSGRWPSPRGADPNPENRREQLLTRRERVTWVGAGLGGLIVLITSNLAAMAPQIFPRLLVVFVVLGGGALAQARVSFASKAATLENDALDADEQQDWGPAGSWPAFAEFCYWTGLLLVVAAGICYCAAVWWPRPGQAHSPPPMRAFTLTVGGASLGRGDRLLAVQVTCSRDCAAMPTAFVSRPVGARLGLKGPQLATGKREPLAAGAKTQLVLRIRPCRARALRRHRNVRVSVRVSALEPTHEIRVTGNSITLTGF
jgi:hypothetical protein